MYHVDKYRLAAKREAESRGLLGDKKRNRGKTQIQVKEEEKVILSDFFTMLTLGDRLSGFLGTPLSFNNS